MKGTRLIMLAVLAVFSLTLFGGIAVAGEKITFKGKVKSVDLKTYTVILTDKKTKEDITITIEDKSTKKKLNDYRIDVGDTVRVKYIKQEHKNIAKYFRKPGGC